MTATRTNERSAGSHNTPIWENLTRSPAERRALRDAREPHQARAFPTCLRTAAHRCHQPGRPLHRGTRRFGEERRASLLACSRPPAAPSPPQQPVRRPSTGTARPASPEKSGMAEGEERRRERRYRREAAGRREGRAAAAAARARPPPSGSHSNRPLRMTLQRGRCRKRGGVRAQRRKGRDGRERESGNARGAAASQAGGSAHVARL